MDNAEAVLKHYYPDYKTDAYLIPDLVKIIISYLDIVAVHTPYEESVKIEGDYVGRYVLKYLNGNIYKECYYEKGRLHGLFIMKEPNGQIITSEEYLHGLKHGRHLVYEKGVLKSDIIYKYNVAIDRPTQVIIGNGRVVTRAPIDQSTQDVADKNDKITIISKKKHKNRHIRNNYGYDYDYDKGY